jgi:hypothetical protein
MKWELMINVEKTKTVVFKKGGKLSEGDKWTCRARILMT